MVTGRKIEISGGHVKNILMKNFKLLKGAVANKVAAISIAKRAFSKFIMV